MQDELKVKITPKRQRVLQGIGFVVFALVFVSLPVAVLLLADFIGTGYSPGWEDGFGLLLNGVCFSLCIILVIVGLGSIILIRTHWIHLGIAILQVEIFAHQAMSTIPPHCRFDYYYDRWGSECGRL
ncbi:MAG: hypothetical protein ACP5J4_12695 [Anaerolineae bacterium]